MQKIPIGSLSPRAISDAGNLGAANDMLEIGDRFEATTDLVDALAEWDQIWSVLTSAQTWVGSNPLNTYQFFDDTNWQILVIEDNQTLVHAHQHFNGMPVIEIFRP